VRRRKKEEERRRRKKEEEGGRSTRRGRRRRVKGFSRRRITLYHEISRIFACRYVLSLKILTKIKIGSSFKKTKKKTNFLPPKT
jgi:hypothetical protein